MRAVEKDTSNIAKALSAYIAKNESVSNLTWLILGGKDFLPYKPASSIDFLNATSQGISKIAVINLAAILSIPMKDMAALLNLSSKTLSRKKKTDALDSLTSSLSIEIANTVSKGLSVFEDPAKFNRWLHKENRALRGLKPFDMLKTPTGIKLVNHALGRIEEGVYT